MPRTRTLPRVSDDGDGIVQMDGRVGCNSANVYASGSDGDKARACNNIRGSGDISAGASNDARGSDGGSTSASDNDRGSDGGRVRASDIICGSDNAN
ncbi:hypothetical protein H4R24_005378, partial [Coemansia sp. RSA 988]